MLFSTSPMRNIMLPQIVFFVVLSLSQLTTSFAATYHVYPGPGTPIQQAVNGAATQGDTIVVHPGTYTENIRITGKAVVITTDYSGEVFLYPQFPASPVIWIDDCFWHTRSNMKIVGIIIQNGNAGIGGGIYINGYSAECTIQECTINNCGSIASGQGGGGIYVWSQRTVGPLIQSCQITNNRGFYGGGIWSQAGNLTIIGCTISSNTAGDSGGGIYISKKLTERTPVVQIKNCNITNNSVPTVQAGVNAASGGGIVLHDSRTDVEDCIIYMNTARYGAGMAVLNDNGGKLSHNTILANRVRGTIETNPPRGGGLYIFNPSTNLMIERNWIKDNIAQQDPLRDNNNGDGGGIFVETYGLPPATQSNFTMRNNFICNNIAGSARGAGIWMQNTYGYIVCNSIAGNMGTQTRWMCTNLGSGIYISHWAVFGNNRIFLANNIVWCNWGYHNGNIVESGAPIGGTGIAAFSCDVHGSTAGWPGGVSGIRNNIVDIDPAFASILTGDLHLSDNTSPLVNGGDSTFTPIDDFDGQSRPLPVATNPDIGADEVSQ
jgi:hypothetical protein